MTDFFLRILATIAAAAITANAVVIWNFNQRLTRIETMLDNRASLTQVTPKTHSNP